MSNTHGHELITTFKFEIASLSNLFNKIHTAIDCNIQHEGRESQLIFLNLYELPRLIIHSSHSLTCRVFRISNE